MTPVSRWIERDPRGRQIPPGRVRSAWKMAYSAATHLAPQGHGSCTGYDAPMRSTFAKAVVTMSALLVAVAVARDASAFCRSSTCRSTGVKECQTDESGCPADGAKLFWASRCISYAVNENGTQDLDPADTREVIQKTFQAWSDVPCGEGGKDGLASMTFQESDPVSCKKSEYNKAAPNVNVVLFQDDDWKYRGIDGTLAKTSVTYNDETGEIYDADIEVNAANNTVTISDNPQKIQYDLQAILTHEVGHFIGVAHSSESDAVMFASYSPGSISQRTLTRDDVGAVCAIYPPGRAADCNVEPRGGFSATCGAEKTTGLCTVASASVGAPARDGGSGRGAGSLASLAAVGLGVLAAARHSRRSNRLRRSS
jgi:hypothetical protein